jgi:hypothetical protein
MVVISYHINVLKLEYVCPFVAGTRHQELGCTRWQYLCDGFCTSLIHIIPVLALVLFLSSNGMTMEASQVREFLKFYFCPLPSYCWHEPHNSFIIYNYTS